MRRIAVVLCLAFTIRTPGQAPSTYDTGVGHGNPPIPTVQSQLPNSLSAGVTAHPFVATYKLSSSRATRYRTFAVRSDGAVMTANSLPDANGHILTARTIELRDRYVVAEPMTRSISTYKPYMPMIVALQDCGGMPDEMILGYPTEVIQQGRTTRWLAVDLNCLPLREHAVWKNGREVTREAISVTLGEPPAEYFNVPSDYQERGPADLNAEFARKFPGQQLYDEVVVDRMQKIYERSRPLTP